MSLLSVKEYAVVVGCKEVVPSGQGFENDHDVEDGHGRGLEYGRGIEDSHGRGLEYGQGIEDNHGQGLGSGRGIEDNQGIEGADGRGIEDRRVRGLWHTAMAAGSQCEDEPVGSEGQHLRAGPQNQPSMDPGYGPRVPQPQYVHLGSGVEGLVASLVHLQGVHSSGEN